jgi:hypothetical protein
MPSLLLHPGEPDWRPEDRPDFVARLADLGLIDRAPADGNPDGFRLGHRFDPQDALQGPPVCRLHFHQYPETRFLSTDNFPRARCPYCRAPADVELSRAPGGQFSCPRCGQGLALHALDWRQAAGFGRCFLEITPVYPHEAVPSDHLMESLRDYSGGAWRYFYHDGVALQAQCHAEQ